MEIKAKKSLSQNFINDKNICKKILNQTSIRNNDIVEIGPGYGFLTDLIISNNPKKLLLIEKDNELSKILKKKYKNNLNVKLLNIDALDYKFNKHKDLIIISNLPYNQSTKIILKLFDNYISIKEMIFLIQKEVALKFDYNILKINKYKFLTKIVSDYKRCFNVPPTVFKPKPKVNSTVVKFKIKKGEFDFVKINKFCEMIFKNRRKKLSSKIDVYNDNIKKNLDKRIDEILLKDLLDIYNFF